MGHQASLIFNNNLKVSNNKMPVGIHEKCTVTSLVKGDNYFDINFSNTNGEVHNKRLWNPNGNYPKMIEGNMETKQEALSREEAANLSHVVKIMHIFLGEEGVAKFPTLDYSEFLDKAITTITPKLNTKFVNLKLIYDNDGMYSVFGNFPDYIEEWTEEGPKLKYSKWELENRMTKKTRTTEEPGKMDLADALRR